MDTRVAATGWRGTTEIGAVLSHRNVLVFPSFGCGLVVKEEENFPFAKVCVPSPNPAPVARAP